MTTASSQMEVRTGSALLAMMSTCKNSPSSSLLVEPAWESAVEPLLRARAMARVQGDAVLLVVDMGVHRAVQVRAAGAHAGGLIPGRAMAAKWAW